MTTLDNPEVRAAYDSLDPARRTLTRAIDALVAKPVPATGKHVRYNKQSSLWEIFFNGQRLGECICEAEAVEVLNVWYYDQQRSGTLYQQRPTATLAGTRIEPQICEDALSTERYGKSWGTRYLVGTGDDECEVFVPDSVEGFNRAELYFLGEDGISPDDMRRILPNLIALLSDPQVLQAVADAQRRFAAAYPDPYADDPVVQAVQAIDEWEQEQTTAEARSA